MKIQFNVKYKIGDKVWFIGSNGERCYEEITGYNFKEAEYQNGELSNLFYEVKRGVGDVKDIVESLSEEELYDSELEIIGGLPDVQTYLKLKSEKSE